MLNEEVIYAACEHCRYKGRECDRNAAGTVFAMGEVAVHQSATGHQALAMVRTKTALEPAADLERGLVPDFTVIDHSTEERGCTTWLRCADCGGVERVYDQPYQEQAQDEAARIHQCPPCCLLCGEPLTAGDAASGEHIDLDCWRDQPTEAALVLGAFIEARQAVAS